MSTICEECGVGYVPDLPEDYKAHKKYHNELMTPLNPKFSRKFLNLVEENGNLVPVNWKSPLWLQRELEFRARRVKWDHYLLDFCWNSDGSEEPTAHGFLFNDDTGGYESGTIVGGCVVRWRHLDLGPKRWWLEWAYVAPRVRRRGIFMRNWVRLENEFEGLQFPQITEFAMKELWAEENKRPSGLSPGRSLSY